MYDPTPGREAGGKAVIGGPWTGKLFQGRWLRRRAMAIIAVNALWLVLIGAVVRGAVARARATGRSPSSIATASLHTCSSPATKWRCRSRSSVSIRNTSTRSSRSRTSGSIASVSIRAHRARRVDRCDHAPARVGRLDAVDAARAIARAAAAHDPQQVDRDVPRDQLDARCRSARSSSTTCRARRTAATSAKASSLPRGRTSVTARSTCRRSRSRRCSPCRKVPRATRRRSKCRAPARAPRCDPRQADRGRRVLDGRHASRARRSRDRRATDEDARDAAQRRACRRVAT